MSLYKKNFISLNRSAFKLKAIILIQISTISLRVFETYFIQLRIIRLYTREVWQSIVPFSQQLTARKISCYLKLDKKKSILVLIIFIIL